MYVFFSFHQSEQRTHIFQNFERKFFAGSIQKLKYIKCIFNTYCIERGAASSGKFCLSAVAMSGPNQENKEFEYQFKVTHTSNCSQTLVCRIIFSDGSSTTFVGVPVCFDLVFATASAKSWITVQCKYIRQCNNKYQKRLNLKVLVSIHSLIPRIFFQTYADVGNRSYV